MEFKYAHLLSSNKAVEVVAGWYNSILDNVVPVCPVLVGPEAFLA